MLGHHLGYSPETVSPGGHFDWRAELAKYHANEVKMKTAETEKYIEAFMPNVERILKYVNKHDPRFSSEPGKVGSFWQKLKVTKADEFDFNVQIEDLGSWVWGKNDPRYYGFNRPILKDQDTVPDDLDVVSTTVPLPSAPKGYTFLPRGGGYRPIWERSNDLVRIGDVVPFLVRRQLTRLVKQAIRDLELRGMLFFY